MTLAIAYITNRREPRLSWFTDSLHRECAGNYEGLQIIVVDFHAGKIARPLPPGALHVPPKPCVWQGAHRLTRTNWFAAGNARNTAICYARGDWIAFVDDLSVLYRGWLAAARQAMTRHNTITCGGYRKVNKLLVNPAGLITFEDNPNGHDSRASAGPCTGAWMFGCSLVAPVAAFERVNGWCEDLCGGIGFEDCVTGLVLTNAGVQFCFDPKLGTIESEEDHHTDIPFRREGKGVGTSDKGHTALNHAKRLIRFDNDFDLADMRRHVLAGEPFPIPTQPTHDWYDNQPLRDMLSEELDHVHRAVVGWCCPEKMSVIYDTILDLSGQFASPLKCVELGVYGGQSLIPAALALRDSQHGGTIDGIDPYTAEASTEGLPDRIDPDKPETRHQVEHYKWWSALNHTEIAKGCRHAIASRNLSQWCRLRETMPDDVAGEYDGLHYIHIDDSHAEAVAMRNAKTWLPKLVPGGVLVLDDAMWSSVQPARMLIQSECELISCDSSPGLRWEVYRKRQNSH